MKVSLFSGSPEINYLKPEGGGIFTIPLKKNGRADFSILLPGRAEKVDLAAAALLKKVLDTGTGCSFEIEYERNFAEAAGGGYLSIGNTGLYERTGHSPTVDLELDGYSISEKEGSLFFCGGSRRGSLSAVTAFIEEDLGGRFYNADDGLCVPELKDECEVVLREYVPPIKLRTMFQWESFNLDFQLFNRAGSGREKFEYVPDCFGGNTKYPEDFFIHTFQKFLSNEEYFEEHPEYFSLIDGERRKQGHGDILGGVGGGQLCFTNPDVKKIVAKNVLKELETYHSYGIMDVSENDVVKNSFCQCEECKKVKEREGSDSGALLEFINFVAGKVADKYPNVKISTLAYVESSKPPKNIKPRENVIIRLANKSGLYPYPIVYADKTEDFYSNFKAWVKLGAELYIWEYTANFLSWLLPRPNLDVIDKDINLFADNGVYGIFLQSNYYGPGENQGKLRAWVYSKKMWDPSLKVEDLIRDFNHGYFGKAADCMQEYSELLGSEWNYFRSVNTDVKNTFVFRDDFYFNARKIFDRALEKVSDNSELRAKIEFEFINVLFYRLQIMPPANEKDWDSYMADLKTFKRLTDCYNVVSISENKTTVKDRIDEWEKEYGKR